MISISIIVPVYNEENTLKKLLLKIAKLKKFANLEIIVINDGSTDNTKKIIQENKDLYDVTKNLEFNQGKGKAIIEGLKLSNKEYIFIQDADLEYEPIDIKKFIDSISLYNADLVMGSRFIGDNRSVLYFWHMFGNKIITIIFNFFNNVTFTDIYCCYCLFKKENLLIEDLKIHHWGQQAEILTYLSKNSKKIFETAVQYNARKYNEGKKIRSYHFFQVLYAIVITRIKLFFI